MYVTSDRFFLVQLHRCVIKIFDSLRTDARRRRFLFLIFCFYFPDFDVMCSRFFKFIFNFCLWSGVSSAPAHAYAYKYVYVYIYVYIYVNICTHIFTYIRIYTYKYIHIYLRIHIYAYSF